MLHVKFENCKSNGLIEEDVFSTVDRQCTAHNACRPACRTHWYGNSSLWPFGPGELKRLKQNIQSNCRH